MKETLGQIKILQGKNQSSNSVRQWLQVAHGCTQGGNNKHNFNNKQYNQNNIINNQILLDSLVDFTISLYFKKQHFG